MAESWPPLLPARPGSQVLGGGFAAWWAMGVHFPTKNKMAAFREFNAEKYNLK